MSYFFQLAARVLLYAPSDRQDCTAFVTPVMTLQIVQSAMMVAAGMSSIVNEWMNECLTTPQHKNKSAIGCQTNDIYIKHKEHL